MAIGAILSAMLERRLDQRGEYAEVEQLMTDMYAAVEKDEQYRPSAHLGALQRLKRAAR